MILLFKEPRILIRQQISGDSTPSAELCREKTEDLIMPYDLYSKMTQRILEAFVVATSFYYAFLIRYEGAIPADHLRQFALLVLPVAVAQLLLNSILGLIKIQRRYVSIDDGLRAARAYLASSVLMLVLRFALPPSATVVRIPANVIVIYLLLALIGGVGIRLLRRYVYKRKSTNATAGTLDAKTAKEMASDPSVEILGFLEDDPRKAAGVIAGVEVLGPTSELIEIVRLKNVNAMVVRIAPAARGSFDRLVALLDGVPVTSKFVPTITEILDFKDGLHMALGYKEASTNRIAQLHHAPVL
jgi:FlaA1/EpsC-like NDP-sugar epimerase